MTGTVDAPVGKPGAVRSALTETGDSLRSVFRNRNLRRIQLAFAGSAIGDWAYATAVTVWAYQVGGAKAVGIWMAIRYTMMAFTSPLAATLVDRWPRKRMMVLTDILRALMVTGAAVCLFLDTPAWPIFVLATLASLMASPFMIAQRSLLPSLAHRPEELTASNGVHSTIESLSFFVGPALAAALLGVTSIQVVFLLNVLTFVWSLVLVLGVKPPAAAVLPETGPTDGEEEEKESFFTETSAGFRTIWNDKGLLLVTIEVSLQTVVAGASAVFMVVMAADVIGTGPEGVGYLDAMMGVGAVLGGFVAISRASKQRLAVDMTGGVLLWALPLLLVTAWASPLTCFLAIALLGLANPFVDVNMDTIIQRVAPDAVLGRVFGALEACLIATMALGALAMPFLLDWVGLRWGLAAVAVPVAVLAFAGLPAMRRLDARLTAPEHLPLLQGLELFAPLPLAMVDSLARSLTPLRVAAGDVVVRQGEESDRFYVIESGLVEVTQDGAVLRREGPGDFFGEIGLLRDVPRTATITAVEDTVLQALDRDTFLAAVTGQGDVKRVADDIVSRRLRA